MAAHVGRNESAARAAKVSIEPSMVSLCTIRMLCRHLVLRAGVAWLDKSGSLQVQGDHLIGFAMRSPLAPAILALPIGIALNLDAFWEYGIRTPDGSLITNKQAVLAFGTAFSFGWLLHGRRTRCRAW
jgi:hypothetical protein